MDSRTNDEPGPSTGGLRTIAVEDEGHRRVREVREMAAGRARSATASRTN